MFIDGPSAEGYMLTLIIAIFVVGYIAIALEHPLHINKAATALLIGALCWGLYALNVSTLLPLDQVPHEFAEHAKAEQHDPVTQFLVEGQFLPLTGETASILFFLMGAMTIVELIDVNEGFSIITGRIRSRHKGQLLWAIGLITFFLSSVLDNLTTTIVMISLLRKLIADRQERLMFAGMVVIAANAGGAWTVIGDVTTTMLWIKNKISTVPVMVHLFLASLTCLIVPLIGMTFLLRGTVEDPQRSVGDHASKIPDRVKWLFLILGLAGLLSVPVFKALTHLPPYVGMMLALSILWIVSEVVHAESDPDVRTSTGLLTVLKRIDMSAVLFFLGILLAVGCLGKVGVLGDLASGLDRAIGNKTVVAVVIGFVSAIVDNVPLVAAGIEMYDDAIDAPFWMLLAYCAGTGGSCLIIGSAAGVAAMGLEKIDFIWYLKNISFWATLGYLAGVIVYLAQEAVF
jgi:Na+/H+ antiporter NhaD/arsenite permease-like protein